MESLQAECRHGSASQRSGVVKNTGLNSYERVATDKTRRWFVPISHTSIIFTIQLAWRMINQILIRTVTRFYAWCVFCILKGFLCTEDEFLLRFLNARKFKIEASFNLLVNYYLYRQRHRHLFIGLNVQDPLIKRALFDGIPGVLPQVAIFF